MRKGCASNRYVYQKERLADSSFDNLMKIGRSAADKSYQIEQHTRFQRSENSCDYEKEECYVYHWAFTRLMNRR